MKFPSAILMCCLLACSAQAQRQLHDTLPEVRVRGKRIPVNVNTVNPVQTLNGDDLKKLNSLSVADAVRYFTGVQLKDYGGIGGLKTINVRSMGTNHTALFYDGVQLGNAQNGQVDLGKFSLDNVEEISLYIGQKSSIFQPAKAFAAASALYIQAKKPVFEEGKNDNLRLALKTGSFGLVNPSVRWEHKLSNRLSSTISSEWTNANGRYKYRYTNGVYDTTATRQNGNVNGFRVEAGLNGILADSSSWSVKLYTYNSSRGLPGAIVANHFEYSQHLWDHDNFLQASYNKKFNRRYQLMANVKYTYLYTRYLDPEYNNIEGYLNNKYKQHEAYASIASHYRINDWWESGLSADFTYNKLNANLYHFAYPTRYTELVALATRVHFPRWEVQASLLGTFVDETVKEYTSAGSKKEYTPAIAASWQPFAYEHFRVRAFYKNIFRIPTFNDLYYTFVGSTTLRPEYTKQYDAGFSFVLPLKGIWQFVSLQSDVYYNEVTDKIVAVPTANLFRWTMTNLGKVEIKGVEASLRTAVQPVTDLRLDLGLNYTWQQAQDITHEGFNYGHQVPYTPWHSGSVTGGASWKALQLNYSFIYTGERYSQKTNIPVNYIEPWYTHDLSLGWSYRKYKVSLEVNNLLDQYYDVVLNFPMPGRNYRLGLTANF